MKRIKTLVTRDLKESMKKGGCGECQTSWNCFYVSCWEYEGSDAKAPELIKEPLHYEAIKVQTRNYKS